MKGACLLLFTLKCLEIVESTLSSHFALELLELVEAHSGSICSVSWRKWDA